VVGFKPGLGTVPRRGLAATIPSLETPGLLARSVDGCRLGYRALTDRRAPTAEPRRLVVGRLDDLFEAADPAVAAPVAAALEPLARGYRLGATRLDWRPRGLGRLFAGELHRAWGMAIRSEPARFTSDIRASDEIGATVSDDERQRILAGLRSARRRLRRRLDAYDVVASPTVPHPVPLAGESSVAEASRFTLAFNALGWPAISVPCGTDAAGMPVGLQLAAAPGRVAALFAVAAAVERLGRVEA
jgi:aspartyl-tRNA(Asn)/glutamyl-tRNA(Gln) amidotransferase subunit A